MAKQKRKKNPTGSEAVEAVAEKATARAGSSIWRAPSDRLVMGAILAVAFLAFTSALSGEFVYDDHIQIEQNPTLARLSSIPGAFSQGVWQFAADDPQKVIGNYYRPVFNSALILIYQLVGLSLSGWHLISILLHLGVTYLVFRLARQWDFGQETAGLAALIFALHPVHVEVVAWIASLPDLLITLFLLGSLLLYEKFGRGEGNNLWWQVASVALAWVAMFTKETAIFFPAFLLARELFGANQVARKRADWLKLGQRILPYACGALIYLFVRYMALGFLSRSDPRAGSVTLLQVGLTTPAILMRYMRLLFLPFPLTFVYQQDFVRSPAEVVFWASALILIIVAGLIVWRVKSQPKLRLALVWTVIFVAPALNLRAFNPFESLAHDRYLYLPSVGFSLLAGAGLTWLALRFGPGRKVALAVLAVVIGGALFSLTFLQNRTWQSDLTMGMHAMRWAPEQAYGFNTVGRYYLTHQNVESALPVLERAAALQPDSYDFQSDLGQAYTALQRYDDAVQAYQRAISLGSSYWFTFYNLGVTYSQMGKLSEAEGAFRRALELRPGYAEASYQLGWIAEQRQQTDVAITRYQESIKANPAFAEPYVRLAGIYEGKGDRDGAARLLQTSLEAQPRNPDVLFALGGLYLKARNCAAAAETFDRLVSLNGRHESAYTSLGLSRECMGDNARAVDAFQRAISVAPQAPATEVARAHLARLQAR